MKGLELLLVGGTEGSFGVDNLEGRRGGRGGRRNCCGVFDRGGGGRGVGFNDMDAEVVASGRAERLKEVIGLNCEDEEEEEVFRFFCLDPCSSSCSRSCDHSSCSC